MYRFVSFLIGLAALPLAAAAQEPVAIVEDATDSTPPLQLFETLTEGREIDLGEGGRLVLGYFSSCIREQVSGGTVVVGREQSEVTGGSVTRETVPCAGGDATLADSEAAESGALVLRAPPGGNEDGPLKVFSATPVFLLPEGSSGALVIRRLDRQAPEISLPVSGNSVDLAEAGPALRLGGRYEVRLGERAVEFEVDPRARYRGGPLIGRLVTL
jgi:hypothetical protein